MFWESIFWEEQDKYQALKWKKPYFPVSITFPRLQQSIHEVPNGTFSNQRTKTFSRLLGRYGRWAEKEEPKGQLL